MPDRLLSLTICSSTCEVSEAAQPIFDERIAAARSGGMATQVEELLGFAFTDDFRRHHPLEVDLVRLDLERAPVEGYVACYAAIRHFNLTAQLPRFTTPTLIIAGEADQSMPLARAQLMHEAIPGSALVVLPGAHICNIEAADAFNAALTDFLAKH